MFDLSILPLELVFSEYARRTTDPEIRYAIIGAGYLWGRYKFGKHSKELKELKVSVAMNIKQVPALPQNYSKGRFFLSPSYIVVHWIVGNLSHADQVFARSTKGVSAHFGVDGNQIHQYVSTADTAHHAGNWLVNKLSVGIEHAGGPNDEIDADTYHSSAELIAHLWRNLKIKPVRGSLRKHNEFYNTACPGTLDLDRLFRLALEYYNGATKVGVDQPLPRNPVQGELASAPKRAFKPFSVDLAPSQTKREEVGRMQDYLVAKGYMKNPAPYRGYYGPQTQAGVHKFQRANGIIASPNYYGWWYGLTRASANKKLNY